MVLFFVLLLVYPLSATLLPEPFEGLGMSLLSLPVALFAAFRLGFFSPHPPASPHPVARFFGSYAATALGIIAVNALLLLACLLLGREPPVQKILTEFLESSSAQRMLIAAQAVVIAPIVEETMFRGLLQPLLFRCLAPLPALGLLAVLFGMLHGFALLPAMAIFSGVLSLLRLHSASLIPPILLHALWNLTTILVLFL